MRSIAQAFIVITASGTALVSAASAQTATFGLTGYTENFDSMGTTGTAAPTGWRHFTNAASTSNGVWTNTTGIPASGTVSAANNPVTTAATVLVASATTPTTNQNLGYNAPLSASATLDRVIGTAPTNVAGSIIQLAINNGTPETFGAGVSLTLGYDIVRYTAPTTANELPGYWVFFSQDGTNWTNLSALNPTLAGPTGVIVPNTVGVTSVTGGTLTLGANWNPGDTLYLRFIDDNAAQGSPDQIIGLNNFSVVPAPASISLMCLAAFAAGRRRRTR